MPPPDKKGLALVLGGPEDGAEEEGLDDKADAMRDLGRALAAKDWSGAALAFERAYEICATKSEEPSEEPDEESPRY